MFRSSAQALAFKKIKNRVIWNLGEDYKEKLDFLSKKSGFGLTPDSIDVLTANQIITDCFEVAFPKDNQGNWKYSFQGRIELIKRLQDTINQEYNRLKKYEHSSQDNV